MFFSPLVYTVYNFSVDSILLFPTAVMAVLSAKVAIVLFSSVGIGLELVHSIEH